MGGGGVAGAGASGDIGRVLGVGSKKAPLWRRWWVLLIAGLLVAGSAWYLLTPAKPTVYIRGKAEVSTIRAIVTATGTLQPMDKVTVGAEVSGRIDEVLVDFNHKVTKGQVIARINTEELNARAQQALAAVAQVEATLAKAEGDLSRAIALRDKGFVSSAAYDAALAARKTAAANLKSARAQAEQAQANLAKAAILSPIDGIVLDRKIERGQTVAASFQAPELFIIASDLSKLKLTVDIDEADIGEVSVGQDATFTVDAYPSQVFKAKVLELRNAARTIQNVVTYQGVLSVENDKGLLKPGMTATADISVKTAENVVSVPNGALRFSPQTAAPVTSMAPTATVAPADPISSGKGKLWVEVKGKEPEARDVTLGITDGQRTQITSSNVKAGEEFILDVDQQSGSGR
ncbi:MAG: efflux RND transporter periplasmic adaptor subunit [Alphaproteobacteria bacterium]|jgi:HlyD family secretion protein